MEWTAKAVRSFKEISSFVDRYNYCSEEFVVTKTEYRVVLLTTW